MVQVSVIVPAYNAEKTIIRCLESIRVQTINQIEIIVVNDGSSDGTDRLVSQYIKDHPTCCIYLINKKNGGPSSARNVGLDYACGHYIGFVDSDDIIAQSMYERLMAIANANKLDVVLCNIVNRYPDGRKSSNNVIIQKDVVLQKKDIENNIWPMLMQENIFGGPCNRIYRRDFLNNHKIRMPENLAYGEDCVFQMQVFDYLNATWFDSNCYYYYLHRENSQSSAKVARLYDTLIPIYLVRLRYAKKWHLSDEKVSNYFVYCAVMDIIATVKNEEFSQKIKYLKCAYNDQILRSALRKSNLKMTDYNTKIYGLYLFMKKIMR